MTQDSRSPAVLTAIPFSMYAAIVTATFIPEAEMQMDLHQSSLQEKETLSMDAMHGTIPMTAGIPMTRPMV